MVESLARSEEAFRISWKALRANPRLLVYLAITFALLLVYVAVSFGLKRLNGDVQPGHPGSLSQWTTRSSTSIPILTWGDDGSWTYRYVFSTLKAVVSSIVFTLLGVALCLDAMFTIRNRTLSVPQSIALAATRWKSITGFCVISIGINVALSELGDVGRLPGVLGSFAGWFWFFFTAFSVPVLALERDGARGAIARSIDLAVRNWVEMLFVAIGALFILVVIGIGALIAVLLVIAPAMLTGITLIQIVVGLVVVVTAAILVIGLSTYLQLVVMALYDIVVEHDRRPGIGMELATATQRNPAALHRHPRPTGSAKRSNQPESRTRLFIPVQDKPPARVRPTPTPSARSAKQRNSDSSNPAPRPRH